MFEPLLSPLFSSLFSSLIAAAQRVFITVNGVDEYFTFQNTKTFPDDFDLSIDAVLPTGATTVTLFGQTASADHYIKVLSTGFVSINIDTSIVTSTVLATKDNKQRVYGVKLIGNDFIFTEDGATIDTVTDAVAAAKTLIINVLCQSNGADFFNRTASDPRLTDLTTASNSVAWQLNRALPATTEQSTDGTNLLTYVGAPETELFTFIDGRWKTINKWDNTPILGSQWTDNGGGSYSYIGDGSFNVLSDAILSINCSYEVGFNVVAISGELKVDIGVTLGTFNTTGNQIFEGVSSNVQVTFSRNSGTSSCTINQISVIRFIETA